MDTGSGQQSLSYTPLACGRFATKRRSECSFTRFSGGRMTDQLNIHIALTSDGLTRMKWQQDLQLTREASELLMGGRGDRKFVITLPRFGGWEIHFESDRNSSATATPEPPTV